MSRASRTYLEPEPELVKVYLPPEAAKRLRALATHLLTVDRHQRLNAPSQDQKISNPDKSDRFDFWLNETANGRKALLQSWKTAATKGPVEAKRYLWNAFYEAFPETRPRPGRPPGFTPTQDLRRAQARVIADALEIAERRLVTRYGKGSENVEEQKAEVVVATRRTQNLELIS